MSLFKEFLDISRKERIIDNELIQRVISEREKIVPKVGQELRSEEEFHDLDLILNAYRSKSHYLGLVGGRLAGKKTISANKLLGTPLGKHSIIDEEERQSIAAALPDLLQHTKPSQQVDLSVIRPYLGLCKAEHLIEDVDIVRLPMHDISRDFEMREIRGKESGTRFEVWTLSPRIFLPGYKYARSSWDPKSVFINSKQM